MPAVSDRIEVSPRVMRGKPVIRGTRITVELIVRKLREGATEAELLDAYPSRAYPHAPRRMADGGPDVVRRKPWGA
jgi:hypothetical protein